MVTRLSVFRLLPLGLLLVLGTGCLFKHHSTNVVRQDETQREVQFESLSARQAFSSKAFSEKSREAITKTDVVAIPLLMWRSRMDILSENAYYNDQVAICDTDGDGLITEKEAMAYHPPATFDELATISAAHREFAKSTPAATEVAEKTDAAPVKPVSYESDSTEQPAETSEP